MARRCVAPEGVRCDLSAASHGSSPPFARRAADNPWSACAQDGAPPAFRFSFGSHSSRIQFAFSSVSIRVPRPAQQSHDLALTLLPCVVEGRLAVQVSVTERQIRASFEETLRDREAAEVCRPMQS